MGDATRILAGLEQGDPAAAERLLPLVYDELRGLAAQMLAHEDLRRALALQQELVDDFPAVRDYRHDLFRSHKTLGWLLGGSNRPEKAEIAFRKAAATGEKLAADYPSVHYYLGGLAEMYHTLGEFRARTGRLPDAEDAFRKSIALYERLVAEFPGILTYGPDLRETYFHLASLLKATNRPEESANVYRKARQVEDDEPQELQRLAWLLVSYPDAQLRDPSLAIELAKKATRLSPQNAKHWRTLDAAHYRAGNWQEASDAANQAREIGGRSGVEFFVLALAHAQLGDKEQAREWYEQGARWMETNNPHREDLQSLRAEAAALLGITDSNANSHNNATGQAETNER